MITTTNNWLVDKYHEEIIKRFKHEIDTYESNNLALSNYGFEKDNDKLIWYKNLQNEYLIIWFNWNFENSDNNLVDSQKNYIAVVHPILLKLDWTDIIVSTINNIDDNIQDNFCKLCNQELEIDYTNKWSCSNCANEIKLMEIGHTHKDYNRVNVIGKFVTNRITHFIDCMKQYQGKQNCKIPPEIYDVLENKFLAYGLLLEEYNNEIRYSKINPGHIFLFLKELKLTKHIENVNLIYYNFTKKRVADISHLEHLLIDDFKTFFKKYDSMIAEGVWDNEISDCKKFKNVQYMLFQLLRRYNHPCSLSNFTDIKTIKRKLCYDKICSKVFEELGWNFTPIF